MWMDQGTSGRYYFLNNTKSNTCCKRALRNTRSLFECTILRDRFNILQENATNLKNGEILIIERSAESIKEVFVRDGGCTDEEWKTYCNLYNELKTTTKLPSNAAVHYVYIRTEADTCSNRIARRNRTGESSIPSEYL